MRTLILLVGIFIVVVGCDPMTNKHSEPSEGGTPPVAQGKPKIVPNHIGSPEWNQAHGLPPTPQAKPMPIPIQPEPGAKTQPIPVKPDPRVKLAPAHTH